MFKILANLVTIAEKVSIESVIYNHIILYVHIKIGWQTDYATITQLKGFQNGKLTYPVKLVQM